MDLFVLKNKNEIKRAFFEGKQLKVKSFLYVQTVLYSEIRGKRDSRGRRLRIQKIYSFHLFRNTDFKD